MALNIKKSGRIANVDIVTDITVLAGDFHIIGQQLGVALTGGVQGDTIAVQLDGEWDLACSGDPFVAGSPLNFSVVNLDVYAGVPVSNDFSDIAVATTDFTGDPQKTCHAIINQSFGTVVV